MENKKSIQLSQAFGAVLTLVLVATLVIIAIVIFVSLQTSFAGTETISIINETVTLSVASDGTGTGTVANSTDCQFANFNPSVVINFTDFEGDGGTNNTLVLTTDYTVDSSAGTITNASDNWATAFVTHSFTWGSEACDASENMTTEFGNYTSLIGLVGTIIFLGLVIGILVTAFAFGGRRET